MSVPVCCKKCGTLLGTWGGIIPPRYDLSNEDMGFPDIYLPYAIEESNELLEKSKKKDA